MSITEIHTRADLAHHLKHRRALVRAVVQDVDLSPVEDLLWDADIHDVAFLGCRMTDALMASLVRRGAVIFPELHNIPYKPYRNSLYDHAELFSGFQMHDPCSYCDTTDAKIYNHWRENGRSNPPDMMEALARRLHDHSISEAITGLTDRYEPQNLIAIMGGHSLGRDTAEYRQVAELSRYLTRQDKLMLSGGGPGAMEATHLGAMLACKDDDVLGEVIQTLSTAPRYDHQLWLVKAYEVLQQVGRCDTVSLGIPTWHYGHEPPTPFASHIAKYFSNATREEGLITLAIGGLIVAPGSAGTIQEVFQDVAQNHYHTTGWISPIIFLGTDYWTDEKGIFPVLEDMSEDRDYGKLIGIADTAEEVLDFLASHPAQPVRDQGFSFCDLFCEDHD